MTSIFHAVLAAFSDQMRKWIWLMVNLPNELGAIEAYIYIWISNV